MKKTFLLLIIVILISGFLASCTGTQMQLDADSDEELVEALKTKISSQSESSTDETATPFSQLNDGDENLAGKERWISELDSSVLFNQDDINSFSNSFVPTIADSRNIKQIYYGRGYASDDRSFYLPAQGERIIAIDSNSGLTKWQSEISGYVLAVGDDTVLVLTGDDRIYGLDKSDGQVKWKIILEMLFEEDTYIHIPPVMHKIDDRFVMILRAFVNSNEASLWLLQIEELTGDNALIPADLDLDSSTIPFFYADNLFVANNWDTNTYMGVDYTNANIIWSISKPDDVDFEIAGISLEEKILYLSVKFYSRELGKNFSDLIAVDMMTGNLIWGGSIAQINKLTFGMEANPYGNDLNCHFVEKYLICKSINGENTNLWDKHDIYERRTGRLLNSFSPERRNNTYLSENGLIVNYDEVGILQGIDYLTGEILWQDDETKINDSLGYDFYEDIILVKDTNGDDFAIDQKTGIHLWTKDGKKFLGVMEDQLLFCVYKDNYLYMVNPMTGEEQKILITAGFDCSDGLIEFSEKILILIDYDNLRVIDRKQ